jgi:cell division protein ZapE
VSCPINDLFAAPRLFAPGRSSKLLMGRDASLAREARSVVARLGTAITAHRLTWDAAQHDAALRLDQLSEKLRRQVPTFAQRVRSHLPWVIFEAATKPQRGLYLWGGVGRGKTLLMDLFYATLPGPQAAPRAERSHFYRFMRHVHAELHAVKRRAQPLEVVAERLAKRARIICLDELFVADIADAMILGGLFDGLFKRGVTLVATSNLPPQDLYKDGLQRPRFLPAIDLLTMHMDVLLLDGGVDYRLRQLEQAPTYLDAKLPQTPQALRQRFATLAGDAPSGPTTLVIEGRGMQAVGTGPGMVWFEFAELCEGPRSQNDYIELARSYHTIFISNIPEFTRADENAARRFIAAVDEFYDRGVKIVVSAAAAPAALYHGEQLQLEFQRAASRLVEMQTQHYLAGEHRP